MGREHAAAGVVGRQQNPGYSASGTVIHVRRRVQDLECLTKEVLEQQLDLFDASTEAIDRLRVKATELLLVVRKLGTHNGGDVQSGDHDCDEANCCVVCLHKPAQYACVPCGHVALCDDCMSHFVDREEPDDASMEEELLIFDRDLCTDTLKWKECPVCRRNVTDVLRLYWP